MTTGINLTSNIEGFCCCFCFKVFFGGHHSHVLFWGRWYPCLLNVYFYHTKVTTAIFITHDLPWHGKNTTFLPEGQLTHCDCADEGLYVPGRQLVQPEDPAWLKVPGPQGVHEVAEDPEKYPALHGMHVDRPEKGLYVPGRQLVQAEDPAWLKVPGPQGVHEVAEDPEKYPALHGMHVDWPEEGLYVPELHAEQNVAPWPEYCPAPHWEHEDLPDQELYVPGWQDVHDEALDPE